MNMYLCQGSLLGLLLLTLGCGASGSGDRPARVPAGGVVLQNGSPVAGATVVFIPVAHQQGASAVTDDAGEFQLMTFDPGDGAVPGRYQVTVRKVEMLPGRPTRGSSEGGSGGESGEEEEQVPPPIEKHLLPEKYAQAMTSGLEADVAQDGENKFTFEL